MQVLQAFGRLLEQRLYVGRDRLVALGDERAGG